MSTRFAYASSPHLVPFNGGCRTRRTATEPPRGHRNGRANEQALADAILTVRTLQRRLPANVAGRCQATTRRCWW